LPEGYSRTFSKPSDSSFWIADNSADTLSQPGGAWSWHRADDDSTYNFTVDGKLQTVIARNGWTTSYAYNGSGQLASVTNAFGRALNFTYAAGNLATVTTPDGRVIGYTYDSPGRLSGVTYPDGKTRSFLYENATYTQALTGIIDETGTRWGTFGYDTQGRATSTQLAGAVSAYQVSYPSSGSANVVDPLGTSRTYSYSTTQSKLAVTGASLPSGEGEADAVSRVQDVNGLITSETDFNGVRSDTQWDVTRRLPISVSRAANKPEATTVTTQWHAAFSLPILVTEPGRTTAYTYDSLGNMLSRAVTDTSASPNTTRTWQWTYNAQNLPVTETAPNAAVTTFEYDTIGNLVKSTNALGHVVQYSYDSATRFASITAPNGLVTTFTYDQRDRVLTRTVGGQLTTTLTYNPTGTLATITLPTGLALTYAYDAAHRLTGWSNNRGEQGSFTLDGMGNRTAEQIKDASGAVAWTAVRSINSINRLYSKTEGPNQTNTFGYDANGERTRETNGLNQSTRYGLDNLRRVSSVTNAANATATLAWNALDAVTQAKDFNGVATGYGRDAQGNATSEGSADIGNRSTQYDSLGLPSQIVDALGQATQIQRDALGRATTITFADGKVTTLLYDQTPTSTGYLSQITDRSGNTTYTRDAFGRVTLKSQTLASGLVQQIGYGYAANGLLATLSYPSGSVLTYQYDSTGRLAQLNWNGAPLISGITWNPMGQPTAWNWAFVSPGLAASRAYDTAGRLTATEFSGYVYDAAGRITNVTQQIFQPADSDPTHTTIASASTSWTVGYDAVGRITGFNASGNTAGFGYDANGNRASSTRTLNGQTTTRTYSIVGSSNQLTGFTQTQGGTSTSVAYGYNANGDLVSDGLRSYSYNAEGRLSDATTGATDTSPTTRYAYNALGQRVFKTEPVYPPSQGDASDPGFLQILINFFTQLWLPNPTTGADTLGFAFTYDEDGNLLAETGTGGANSSGSAAYISLPTASGAMPIAVVINGATYAVQSDHLNTPRRLTDSSGQPVWQWAYSAFGDEKPTLAKNRFANLDINPNPGTTGGADVTFNLRYLGQYFDAESGLNYNYFRSYSADRGRYTQPDPIGLVGGWNRFSYVSGNPLGFFDPDGLQQTRPLRPLENQLLEGGGGGGGGPALGMIGAGVGAWIGWNVLGPALSGPDGIGGPMAAPDPMEMAKGGQSQGRNWATEAAKAEAQGRGVDPCDVIAEWLQAAKSQGDSAKVRDLVQAEKFLDCRNKGKRKNKYRCE
jgi:RHS repeat-associated protein